MSATSLSRRWFVGVAGAAALGEWLRAGPLVAQALAARSAPPAPLGYSAAPSGDVEQALWWLAETIVPGTATDPSGAPGANDCGALNVLLDPALPLAATAPAIVVLLDGHARDRHDRRFVELDAAARVDVAETAEAEFALMTLVYRLIRAAFYGAAYNEVGTRWLGFPGENLGYIDHPDFTLGRPVSRELGDGGNLP